MKTFSRTTGIDLITGASMSVDYAHHEIHSGSSFFVVYSVASLGDMITPNDMITLTWTTPNTTKWGHFLFEAKGTSGWRVRMIEAPTGAAITETGNLTCLNTNRNSTNTSDMIAIDTTVGEISYDATLATGGVTLVDEYIEGASQGNFTSAASTGSRDEIILKQNTKYQISLFGTDADPGSLKMKWYEHTNKE